MIASRLVECGIEDDPFVDGSGGYVRLRMTSVSALNTAERVETVGGSCYKKEDRSRVVWEEGA